MSNIGKRMTGEFIGCFILGYIGLGTIYTAIVYKYGTVMEIGIMFGITITFAVIISAPISGAVLNPGITIAQALFRKFPWKLVPAYILAQVAGWFLGCLLLLATANDSVAMWETSLGIIRGNANDVYSAQIFLCNMPNMLGEMSLGLDLGSKATAWPVWASVVNELLASMLLMLSVAVFTDPKNRFRPPLQFFPLWLGFIVALAIMFFLPGSTACMNSARDFGPRLALALFGWGDSTFPGLGWGLGGIWWVWWVVPTLGAIGALFLYEKVLCPSCTDNALADKTAAQPENT